MLAALFAEFFEGYFLPFAAGFFLIEPRVIINALAHGAPEADQVLTIF